MFPKKRKRASAVKLNNRFGSRRNRILISFSLLFIAGGIYLSNYQSESTLNYLVAAGDLAAGSKLTSENVSSVPASIGGQGIYYLTDSDKVSSWYLDRPIRSGELIPKSALASIPSANCQTLKIGLTVALAHEIRVGDYLDIWAGQQNAASEQIPTEIVSDAPLLALETNSDALSQVAETAELCVSVGQIRSVVNAIALREVIIGVKSD